MITAPAASTPAARRVMQGNRRAGTGPELALRRELHALGVRYRVDRRVPTTSGWVRPDISIARWRLAVFLDGCFWHGCPDHGTQPRIHSAYWQAKIERNQDRDHRDTEALLMDGWTVLRVWEHEPPAGAARRILQGLLLRREGAVGEVALAHALIDQHGAITPDDGPGTYSTGPRGEPCRNG